MTIFKKISENEIPMSLLLDADPSEKCIENYLRGSTCFGAFVENSLVGVCVTNSNESGVAEIFNIVVTPEKQNKGIGTELLKFVIAYFVEIGATTLELGTGTFGYQLLYYQRFGFRAESVWKNHFIDNYSEPICDHGLQLKDMLRLSLKLNSPST
jgi:N-acetylglutamate synthase-like GNAT family acetyltransferase